MKKGDVKNEDEETAVPGVNESDVKMKMTQTKCGVINEGWKRYEDM